MAYQPGNGTVEVELAKLQIFAVDADEDIVKLKKDYGDLKEIKDKLLGSLKVLIWMNGIIMAVLVVILGTVLTWSLNHITIRTNFSAPGIISQDQIPPTDSAVEPH